MDGEGLWDLFLWSVSSDYRGQLVTLGHVSLQGTVIRCMWAAVRHGNVVRCCQVLAIVMGNSGPVTGVVVPVGPSCVPQGLALDRIHPLQ